MTNEDNIEENISVPKWVLENIKETLRIQMLIYQDEEDSCQKRLVKTALIQTRKLLNNEEITGNERLENL